MQKWTPEEIEKLKRLKDLPLKEQSKITGMTNNQIKGARRRFGFSKKRDYICRKWTDDLESELRIVNHLSIKEQVQITGLTSGQIRYGRRRSGLAKKHTKWTNDLQEKVRAVNQLPVEEQCRVLGMTKGQLTSGKTTYKLARQKTYRKDIDFFGRINPTSTYWASFILGDGYILNNRIITRLSIKDKQHLERFKMAIGFGGPIHEYKRQDSRLKNGFSHGCYIDISSSKLVEDLQKNFRVNHDKTQNADPIDWFERLGETKEAMDLSISQMMGLIDSDGCLCIKDKNIPHLYIYLCGNHQTCVWVKKFAEIVLKEKLNLKIESKPPIFTFCISCSKAVRFYNFVIQNCPPEIKDTILKRKWFNPKVVQVVETYNSRNHG